MAFLDHQGESEFPFPKNTVFEALLASVSNMNGLSVATADKLTGRILVKAGVSLFSWGENIPIQLSEIETNRTLVRITSSPKTGVMFGGAMDMGKNRKNIEAILAAASALLSSQEIPEPAAPIAPIGSRETPAPDITLLLGQLGQLRDSGVLTGAEFDTKKAELLARL